MVIGEKFAWAHIGRTGGDATAQYFSVFNTYLKLEIDPSDLNAKHNTFRKRNINNKILALNIRRLPSFILSHIFFMVIIQSKSVSPRDALDIENPLSYIPDKYINTHTHNLTCKINYWLRMEHLKEDIINFMRNFLEITPTIINEIYSLKTKAIGDYDHNIHNHWSPEEVEILYKNNPIWSKIEKEQYGNTLNMPLDKIDYG